MNPAIATLHGRMAAGGDWRQFQQEIADLHNQATTEHEYLTLIEAHQNLIRVGEQAFDAETYAKILPVAESEYLLFLNKESVEDGVINPVLLDRVTRREVEAGRLDSQHPLRLTAEAAAQVLGDSAEHTAHSCRNGNYLFLGMAGAAVMAVGFIQVEVSPFWIIAIGLVLGWFVNERERIKINKAVGARRT